MRTALLLATSTLAAACASSPTIPEIDPAKLHDARFGAIEPRAIAVEVVDERKRDRDDGGATVAHVRGAIVAVLARSGLRVAADASSRFVVTVRNSERPMAGFSDDACIDMVGELRLAALEARAQATACYEFRHLLGFSLGANTTRAYEDALNVVLDALAGQAQAARASRAASQ